MKTPQSRRKCLPVMSDKGFVSRTYKELSKYYTKKMDNPVFKTGKKKSIWKDIQRY